MRVFIAPDLSFSYTVYFHSFVPIDHAVGKFGVYTNASQYDVQDALADIAAAIAAEGTFKENDDLYRREFMVDDEEAWIQLDNGDAIANSWQKAAKCREASVDEVLSEVFDGNLFCQPMIEEGTVYTFTDESGEEFRTMERDEAYERAADIDDIIEEDGFIAWFSNGRNHFDPEVTEYEIFGTYDEAAEYLFEQRPNAPDKSDETDASAPSM